jgi:hypothetical protein
MVQRITLSLPDELHEQIQKYKDEMNLSGIFQDAVSKAIEKKEAFKQRLKEATTMEAVIERLKQEKQNAGNDYYEIGQKDGLAWVKTASYEELQHALDYETMQEHSGYTISYDPCTHEVLGEYFSDIIGEDPNMGFEQTGGSNYIPNHYFQSWEQGWKDAVVEFWEEIKDKI